MNLPVGTVLPYASPANEHAKNELKNSGFLFCDGKEYKQGEYPKLYNVIKDAYALAYGKDKPPSNGYFRATSAPSLAKAMATARPIPLSPPVIRAR